ncbi:MAG: alpha-amylase [Oscillospiraceae bacterium]
MNGTLIQYFEWYLPDDAKHWQHTAQQAQSLADVGITAVWLPPAYKGANGVNDVGYGVYDTYDLGEFNQKGSIPTKYGTKVEYLQAIEALHKAGLQVLADIVLNHRIGADECENAQAVEDAGNNRNNTVSGKETISVYTKFNFPNRNGKYSTFTWNKSHFDGVDWDAAKKRSAVFKLDGKSWDKEVDGENGNYDYLMGADLDMSNPEVINELDNWGLWYLNETGVDGLRLDAVKHISFEFFTGWLERLRSKTGKELFAVGEYWKPDLNVLQHYLGACRECMSLFDVPLHFNFFAASHGRGDYDMRHILDNSLVSVNPTKAVTFVDNHDTQPGQALASWVDGWFKPLAYAIILLREAGYPCVFYGDYYGIQHDNISPVGDAITAMIKARKTAAYGVQHDYFDHPNIIAWTREGVSDRDTSGIAVLLSDGPGGEKRMYVGTQHAKKVFAPVTGGGSAVTIDDDGCAVFSVDGGSARVYVRQK